MAEVRITKDIERRNLAASALSRQLATIRSSLASLHAALKPCLNVQFSLEGEYLRQQGLLKLIDPDEPSDSTEKRRWRSKIGYREKEFREAARRLETVEEQREREQGRIEKLVEREGKIDSERRMILDQVASLERLEGLEGMELVDRYDRLIEKWATDPVAYDRKWKAKAIVIADSDDDEDEGETVEQQIKGEMVERQVKRKLVQQQIQRELDEEREDEAEAPRRKKIKIQRVKAN